MIRPDKLFPDVPDAASLWTYVSSRPLSQSEDAALDSVLSEFFRTWTSHERLVSGESLLLESRFLLIAAHISDGDISGCGIDKSTRMLEDFALANEFEWHDGLDVHYRGENGLVQVASRSAFRTALRAGTINGETTVFDITSRSVGELRSSGFEVPLARSWHGRVFEVSPFQDA